MTYYYGAAYYPEQWPEHTWEPDIRLMKQAGLNATRIAEFAWSRIESSPDCYDWTWLDKVMKLLHENDIGVVLCTPSASPPMWVVDACPGMLNIDVNRIERPAGARRHYCPNNPEYRLHSVRIAGAMAQRYGNHPALIGWQIDNEFGEGVGPCYCDVCAAEFRNWLKEQYASLEALNEAWGTVFWSGQYNSWDQIKPPMQGSRPFAQPLIPGLRHNPGWVLDYERFSSDSFVAYQNLQENAVRPHTDKPVTHNGMGLASNNIDYYDLFKTLDVCGYDCYPSVVAESYSASSRNMSHSRNLTGKPPWILELSSGGGFSTWGGARPQAPPGALRLVAWHVFANGGEMALYFQWRMMAKGAEQLESSILELDGVPRRKYEELKRTASELKRLEPWLSQTQVKSDVALIFSYDHHWAHSLKPFSNSFSYSDQSGALYDALVAKGLNVDVVSLEADLTKYRMVVLPSPILMTPEIAAALKSYVHGGGVLLSTFLTGVKDWHNVGIWDRPLPGYLDDLFGVNVVEVDPGCPDLPTRIALDTGACKCEVKHSVWSDVLETVGRDTDVIGRIVGSYRAGEPVITRNRAGKGLAYYLGAWLEKDALSTILDEVLNAASVLRSPIIVPEGVELIRRTGGNLDVTFLLNWTYAPVTLNLNGLYTDLMTDRRHEGVFELAGRDVAYLRKES